MVSWTAMAADTAAGRTWWLVQCQLAAVQVFVMLKRVLAPAFDAPMPAAAAVFASVGPADVVHGGVGAALVCLAVHVASLVEAHAAAAPPAAAESVPVTTGAVASPFWELVCCWNCLALLLVLLLC